MKDLFALLVALIACLSMECHVETVPSAGTPRGRPAVVCSAPDECVFRDGDMVIEGAALYQDYAGTEDGACPPAPRLCHLRLLADLYDPVARTWLRNAVCVRPPDVQRPELDALPSCYAPE